jgi:hypothetical protein
VLDRVNQFVCLFIIYLFIFAFIFGINRRLFYLRNLQCRGIFVVLIGFLLFICKNSCPKLDPRSLQRPELISEFDKTHLFLDTERFGLVGNTASCFGVRGFESRPGDRCPVGALSWVSLICSTYVANRILTLRCGRFIPHPFQFVPRSLYIRRYRSLI